MYIIRRRTMLQNGGGVTPSGSLLEQGVLSFNGCTITISDRRFTCTKNSSGSDPYEVKRYFNVTEFSANETTGTGKTADISNRSSGFVIPAGAECVFSASDDSFTGSASYSYIAVLLRDTATNNIKRIGAAGNNKPTTSAAWTASADTAIGCIAIEYSHGYTTNKSAFTLSLTVNGVEWL